MQMRIKQRKEVIPEEDLIFHMAMASRIMPFLFYFTIWFSHPKNASSMRDGISVT